MLGIFRAERMVLPKTFKERPIFAHPQCFCLVVMVFLPVVGRQRGDSFPRDGLEAEDRRQLEQ